MKDSTESGEINMPRYGSEERKLQIPSNLGNKLSKVQLAQNFQRRITAMNKDLAKHSQDQNKLTSVRGSQMLIQQ